MNKNSINKIALAATIGFGLVFLVSCTANFSTDTDRANIMYAYDMGTTRFFSTQEEANTAFELSYGEAPDIGEVYNLEINSTTFNNIYCFQDFTVDYRGGLAVTLNNADSRSVTYDCLQKGIQIPSKRFWSLIDLKVINKAWDLAYHDDITTHTELTAEDLIKVDNNYDQCGILVKYGAVKFSKQHTTNWDVWNNWVTEIKEEFKDDDSVVIPNYDFIATYQEFIYNKASNIRSCISVNASAPQSYGNFGWGDNHYAVWIEGKNWASAWQRGFLEGLLVYPVAAMTEVFSHSFGMGGWGQLGAILLVTFIARTFLALVSIKSTIGQQKMQLLQPELSKIQAKYPNADTVPAQKQRLSQEQMALYKKNHINPLATLLVLVVQFPLFIAVWGGLQGSAALATDSVIGLYLSESIWNTLTACKGLPSNSGGWWTALILVILMAAGQFISMKLPQWLQKRRSKDQPKLVANPNSEKTQKQMKWFGYIMLVVIIIMGFTLPAGMGVYWLAGALFSVVQTLITQYIISQQMQLKRG